MSFARSSWESKESMKLDSPIDMSDAHIMSEMDFVDNIDTVSVSSRSKES